MNGTTNNKCPECNGTGVDNEGVDCVECLGAGGFTDDVLSERIMNGAEICEYLHALQNGQTYLLHFG